MNKTLVTSGVLGVLTVVSYFASQVVSSMMFNLRIVRREDTSREAAWELVWESLSCLVFICCVAIFLARVVKIWHRKAGHQGAFRSIRVVEVITDVGVVCPGSSVGIARPGSLARVKVTSG